MLAVLFVAYLVGEVAALAWLASTFGVGVAVLTFLGVTMLGWAVLASRGRRALSGLATVRTDRTPEGVLTDGAMTGVATGLILVPGIVTTLAGLLLSVPPVRAALRPLVRAKVDRTVTSAYDRAAMHRHGPFVDGEVIGVYYSDGHDATATGRLTGPRTAARPSDHDTVDGTVIEGEIIDPRDGRDRP